MRESALPTVGRGWCPEGSKPRSGHSAAGCRDPSGEGDWRKSPGESQVVKWEGSEPLTGEEEVCAKSGNARPKEAMGQICRGQLEVVPAGGCHPCPNATYAVTDLLCQPIHEEMSSGAHAEP